jgi:toxin ParE1/3/4
MTKQAWRPFLSTEADRDFASIVEWTTRKFGRRQASIYQENIFAALERLRHGPNMPGAKMRNDIGPGLYMLHVARRGRPASHVLLYRPRTEQRIEILRILHTSMDISRHLSASNLDEE